MTNVKMKQKEAVYHAVIKVLTEAGVDFEEGQNVDPLMSRELRAQVNDILIEGFRSDTIELNKEFTDQQLKNYVSGLQSNWIRKDRRLNGDTQYVAKNPGSRAGQGDATLKALRQVLRIATTDGDRAEIQAHIDTRVAEIAAEKAKTTKVDVSALPAALAAKFSHLASS